MKRIMPINWDVWKRSINYECNANPIPDMEKYEATWARRIPGFSLPHRTVVRRRQKVPSTRLERTCAWRYWVEINSTRPLKKTLASENKKMLSWKHRRFRFVRFKLHRSRRRGSISSANRRCSTRREYGWLVWKWWRRRFVTGIVPTTKNKLFYYKNKENNLNSKVK